MAAAKARTLDELAAKLGRPPKTLAPFARLRPEQIELLSHLIDEACARRRQSLDDAIRHAIPALLRPLLLPIVRG